MGSEDDKALPKLKKYLLTHILDADDVREVIRNHYL